MTITAQDLADANLLEALREHARWQPDSELVEEDGLLMMADATGFPAAFRNCVARIDRRVSAADMLARAGAFFGERRRGFTVFCRDSRDADVEALVRERGYTQRSDSPCMLVETPVAMPSPPSNVHLERFEEVRHVVDAIDVLAETYQAIGLPAQETRAYFPAPEWLIARGVRGCVVYDGREPLATALVIDNAPAAGIYWVGTVSAAQRLGLASVCTALLTNDAFARGATVVTLQASRFGEPVYRRLGYRDCDRLKFFRHLG